jgi:hypothetical protein
MQRIEMVRLLAQDLNADCLGLAVPPRAQGAIGGLQQCAGLFPEFLLLPRGLEGAGADGTLQGPFSDCDFRKPGQTQPAWFASPFRTR